MSQTPPPSITPLPTPPSTSSPSTFAVLADQFLTALLLFATQIAAVASNVYNNAVDCYNNAVAALASQVAAAASAASASTSASNAAGSVTAAAAAAGAVVWQSGTTYSQGQYVKSPADNYRVYARTSASGGGTIDPKLDTANYSLINKGGLNAYTGVLDSGTYNLFMNYSGVVTLPDLTTVSTAFGLGAQSNSVAVPANVTTSDGWNVATGFVAGTLKQIAPVINPSPTPHGYWGSLAMTPPANSSNASGSGAGANPPLGSVALSATCHVTIFYDSTKAYFIAHDPTTGLSNGVVTFTLASINPAKSAIYATSATSFVAFLNTDSATSTAVAGTLSGTSISLGSGSTFGGYFCDTPVQLSASTYLLTTSAANDLVAITVSGISITTGTAVASGATTYAAANRLAPISATTALVAFPTAGTGPTTITFRVVTVTGTTITLGATAVTATAVCYGANGGVPGLFALAVGGPYLYCQYDNTTTTTGNFYGVTVSGVTVTVGGVSAQANLTLNSNYRRVTFATDSAASTLGKNAKAIDATRCVILHNGNLYAISFSGTTLTFGAAFALVGAQAFLTDVATGANVYAVGSGTYSKLSVTGTTITAAYTVAVAPVVVFSDTLTDKAVKYSGTWYNWAGIPTAALAVSSSKYISTAAWPTINLYGSFA